jgi:hypothetical protein
VEQVPDIIEKICQYIVIIRQTQEGRNHKMNVLVPHSWIPESNLEQTKCWLRTLPQGMLQSIMDSLVAHLAPKG